MFLKEFFNSAFQDIKKVETTPLEPTEKPHLGELLPKTEKEIDEILARLEIIASEIQANPSIKENYPLEASFLEKYAYNPKTMRAYFEMSLGRMDESEHN